MRCPFCHNGNLVQLTEPIISEEDVLTFLAKRRTVLEGLCITGGEPTLNPDLVPFIRQVKAFGYKVKLDTNGLRPDVLMSLIQENLLDYVAMDVKNDIAHYHETSGIPSLELSAIETSVQLLKDNQVSYEFRTTVVKEFHTPERLAQLAQWLQGPSRYYLQNYEAAQAQLSPMTLSGFTQEELITLLETVKPYLPNAKVRGLS